MSRWWPDKDDPYNATIVIYDINSIGVVRRPYILPPHPGTKAHTLPKNWDLLTKNQTNDN